MYGSIVSLKRKLIAEGVYLPFIKHLPTHNSHCLLNK